MSKLIEHFHLPLFEGVLPPRHNIAPTQPIAAVRVLPGSAERELAMFRWGLVPAWAEDATIGRKMINARAETAAVKPAFRSAFRHRRCLIPADGFYEWQTIGKQKLPHLITLREGGLFAIAGLWERWERPDQTIESCTLLTIDANDLLLPIHNRMPCILSPEEYSRWLDPSLPSADRNALLRPFDASAMSMTPTVIPKESAGPELF